MAPQLGNFNSILSMVGDSRLRRADIARGLHFLSHRQGCSRQHLSAKRRAGFFCLRINHHMPKLWIKIIRMKAKNTLAIIGTPFLWASWLILSNHFGLTGVLCAHSLEQCGDGMILSMVFIHDPTDASLRRSKIWGTTIAKPASACVRPLMLPLFEESSKGHSQRVLASAGQVALDMRLWQTWLLRQSGSL
jgi:hypothetical protein